MIEGGYVKAYRKMMEWKWWSDSDTVKVFLYILFRANLKDGAFNGEVIPRGSFVTSRKTIAHDCYISEQTTRTILNRLKSTNEITIRTTSKYTVITALNYDEYQSTNQVTNQQLTNNQPTTNQQLTTEEECKNIKEWKNNELEEPSAPKPSHKKKDKTLEEALADQSFSDSLKNTLSEWLKYRKQIKKPFKTTIGFEKLLTQIRGAVNEYGETKVINLINEGMSNGWQGIIFDRLKEQKGVNTNGRNGTNNTRDNRVGENSERSEPYAGSAEWYERLAQKAKDMAASGNGENPRDLPFT